MTFKMDRAAGMLKKLCDDRVQAHRQDPTVNPAVSKADAKEFLQSQGLWPDKLYLIKRLYNEAGVVTIGEGGVSTHLITKEYYEEIARNRRAKQAAEEDAASEPDEVAEESFTFGPGEGATVQIDRPGYRVTIDHVISLTLKRLLHNEPKGKKRN